MASSQDPTPTAQNPKKSIAKKKSSKGSKGSSFFVDEEPFQRDTTQLFSINPLDYDESIRVMIGFIANHPISIPLTKIPEPPLPLHHLHRAFTCIKLEDGTLELPSSEIELFPSTNRPSSRRSV